MKFGSGQSWESQSTPEVKLQAAKAFARPPAAIVQVAKNNAYYEKAIETCDALHAQERARIIKEWKESKTWQDKYDTWEAACELVLDMTSRHTNRLIASVSEDSGHLRPDSTDKSAKRELKALKQVEKARETPAKDEQDEKPAVHAATPEQMDGAKAKAKPAEPEAESDKPPMDASGAVIPQHLLPLRDRRQEVTDAEYHASKLGALLENLQSNGKDPLWAHLMATGSLQTYAHSAKTIRHNLAECLPDVVCPQCEGKVNSKCGYCCGSGWISEVRWNRDYVKSHDSQKLATVAKRNGKA